MTAVNDSATLVLRATKGSPLTNTEGDDNFTSLDDTKLSATAPVVLGPLTIQQCLEVQTEKTNATGTVNHDFSVSAIYYHSAISANFTVNLINLPTTIKTATVDVTSPSFAVGFTLVLAQGATGYFSNAFQIAGVAQTIKWANGTVPTASSGSGKVDVVTFSIVRTSTPAWIVMAQLLPFA